MGQDDYLKMPRVLFVSKECTGTCRPALTASTTHGNGEATPTGASLAGKAAAAAERVW
ncbi:hypothetical protein XBLMG947_0514 [Xanthomonas bromi]|uniref:Uncharacterized protein n=1 Tax=Xanthomonas bromi TaxID=56449 RepID=A0A1C3NH72_9XANT|nr:hypothetical protein XBLMG947_0514 [Xanthomonas bromi]